MYVRGYLQGNKNGRVVTIEHYTFLLKMPDGTLNS